MSPSLVTSQLIAWGPYGILSLIGIGVALAYFNRYPVPASLVLLACILSLLRAIVTPVIYFVGIDQGGIDRASFFAVVSLINSVTGVVTFGLLITAAFIKRGNSAADTNQGYPPFDPQAKPFIMAEMAGPDDRTPLRRS